jgi:hypothetical protein
MLLFDIVSVAVVFLLFGILVLFAVWEAIASRSLKELLAIVVGLLLSVLLINGVFVLGRLLLF